MKNHYFRRLIATSLAILSFTLFSPVLALSDTLHVSSSITPQEMVQGILIGGGVFTSNITYTGNNISRGKFWGGPGNIGVSDGIILTSGNVNVAVGPNNAGNAGADSGQPGDPDLTAIAGVSTFDACVLEFDFVPQSNVVSFRYVFGSEEYHEYVNASYNDAFGFFISGPGITGPYSNNSKNIALIPLTDVPVSINTVNCGNPYNCANDCDHCQYFVNNTQQFTQYDAFTKVLKAWANVIPCETYHIKLAVGDGGDHIYDSGVFLEANSFSSVGIESELDFSQPDENVLIEGCNNVSIMFTLSVQPDADYYMPLQISGAATNGVDYEYIPDSVFFPEGYTQAFVNIVTIPDDIPEYFENVRLIYNSSLCDVDYDTINISLKDYQLNPVMTPDTTINCATEATVGVDHVNGYGPYSYVWSTGDTTQYITVSPLITTKYYVTVSALCDSLTTDSVIVHVDGPKSNAGTDQSVPYGSTTTLQGSASQGSGDYTYLWAPDSLLVDPTVQNPTTLNMHVTTQFSLTVTDLAGGCQDIDHMLVLVTGGPLNVLPIATPDEICYGESTQLFSYASGGTEDYTYLWTSDPPGFSSDLSNPVVIPSATTTYYVSINDGYNTVNGNVTVTVDNLPLPDGGPNDTIFNGTIGHLFGSATQGSGDYSWSWQPAGKLVNPYAQNPVTVKLYETTLFRLTATDNNTGCVSPNEDMATVVVVGGPLAVTAQVTDPAICGGETTQLHALPSGGNSSGEPPYTFSWSSDPPGFTSIEQEPYIAPVENTTYTVNVYDGFNTVTSQVSVWISQPPVVDLGSDMTACPLDTVVISTNNQQPDVTYLWSNGSVEPSITVGTTGIGFDYRTVWVRVANEFGCTTTDTMHVIFDFSQCSGIHENQGDYNVYIYPNPTTGQFSVEWNGLKGNVEMQISDLHGQVVLDKNIESTFSGDYKGTFNLAGNTQGIYLLKLISNENVIIKKILLQ